MKQYLNLRNVVKIGVTCLAAMTMFSGCKDKNAGNDEGTPTNGAFKVKSAVMTFKKVDSGVETTETVMWDDYGKLYRIGDDETATIIDEKAGKGYGLDHKNKTYIVLSEWLYSTVITGRNAWKFVDGTNMPAYQKLPNRTIADKDCSVYSTTSSGVTTIYGGWNEIQFLREESGVLEGTGITVSESYTAISYSETVPAGSFTVPSDYTFDDTTF